MLTKVRENGYRANAGIRLEAFIKNVEMILVILTTSPRGLYTPPYWHLVDFYFNLTMTATPYVYVDKRSLWMLPSTI